MVFQSNRPFSPRPAQTDGKVHRQIAAAGHLVQGDVPHMGKRVCVEVARRPGGRATRKARYERRFKRALALISIRQEIRRPGRGRRPRPPRGARRFGVLEHATPEDAVCLLGRQEAACRRLPGGCLHPAQAASVRASPPHTTSRNSDLGMQKIPASGPPPNQRQG